MDIKLPSGRHKAFRVIKRTPTGSKTFKHPEIDAINREYLAGELCCTDALTLLKVLLRYVEIGALREQLTPTVRRRYVDLRS